MPKRQNVNLAYKIGPRSLTADATSFVEYIFWVPKNNEMEMSNQKVDYNDCKQVGSIYAAQLIRRLRIEIERLQD